MLSAAVLRPVLNRASVQAVGLTAWWPLVWPGRECVAGRLHLAKIDANANPSVTVDPISGLLANGMTASIGQLWRFSPAVAATGAFTFSCWIYTTVALDNNDGLARDNGTGNNLNFFASKVRWFTGSDQITATTATPLSRWNHYVFRRVGAASSTFTLWLNGVIDTTGTPSATTFRFDTLGVASGTNPAHSYQVADFRYYDGYAVPDEVIRQMSARTTRADLWAQRSASVAPWMQTTGPPAGDLSALIGEPVSGSGLISA